MSCLILILGFLVLGIAVLYVPFLTAERLAISLALSCAAFLIGLWVNRAAASRDRGGPGRVGGALLMVTSVACAGLLLFVTSPGELLQEMAADGRSPSKKGFKVELVSPRDDGRRVDDDFRFSISGAAFSDRNVHKLRLKRVSNTGGALTRESFELRSTSLEDDGRTVVFTPEAPLDFTSTYRGSFDGVVVVSGKTREITSEWDFTTDAPTVVDGVDPGGFAIRIGSSGTSVLRMEGGSIPHGSPVETVAVLSDHDAHSVELGRTNAKPGWPATIEFETTAEQAMRRVLWVSALDREDHPVARFPISRLQDEDGRGVFLISKSGVHTTPDGVTIRYGTSSWQRASGEKAPGQVPILVLRVERLLEYECLSNSPAGFEVVGCYEITAKNLSGETIDPTWGKSTTGPSGSRGPIEESRLIPSFSLSMPAPAWAEEGRVAVAVVREKASRHAPDLLLTGVGHVVSDDGDLRIRLIKGGDTQSIESVPSGIGLGGLFEADAMIGRRAVLVAKGPPDTTLVVGTGWNHLKEEYDDGRIIKKSDGGLYFTTSLDIVFKPPTFGRVNAAKGFILPMIVGESSLLVRRDSFSGWILDRNKIPVPRTSEWLTDVGSLRDLPTVEDWKIDRWDDEIRAMQPRN